MSGGRRLGERLGVVRGLLLCCEAAWRRGRRRGVGWEAPARSSRRAGLQAQAPHSCSPTDRATPRRRSSARDPQHTPSLPPLPPPTRRQQPQAPNRAATCAGRLTLCCPPGIVATTDVEVACKDVDVAGAWLSEPVGGGGGVPC